MVEPWIETVSPIPVPPVGNVGLLICADAYTTTIASTLKAQGAQMLVSAAAGGQAVTVPTANGNAVVVRQGFLSWCVIVRASTGRCVSPAPKASW